jgi:hypothetical protein
LAYIGLFTLLTWLLRKPRPKRPKALPPQSLASNGATDGGARKTARPARRKLPLGRLTAVLTLIFAYLAVAVNAHWYPWQINIPSITLYLDVYGQSRSDWYSDVNRLTNFLTNKYTSVVYLNITMVGFAKPTVTIAQSLYLSYGPKRPGFAAISSVNMAAECPAFNCIALQLNIVSGPGSNLGYTTQNSANTASIEGFYQVGAIACQTGYCDINIIPVEPPN